MAEIVIGLGLVEESAGVDLEFMRDVLEREEGEDPRIAALAAGG